MTLDTHPLSGLVPEMTDDEYQLLLADIHEHGLYNPITLFDGAILDGRHRHRAISDLEEQGVAVEPKFTEFKGTEAEAASYVISLNIHRRHLTTGQRAMIAVPLMKTLQAANGQGTRTDLTSCNIAGSENAELAAAAVNVSPRSIYAAAKLIEEAPELAEQVRNGHMELWQAESMRNGKHKPKTNRAGDTYEPQGYDACQTPVEALDLLLPYLDSSWHIWEPAQGERNLVEGFYDSGMECTGTDILTGQNFFEYEPEAWDALVTNPPYSIKYEWLGRCYALGKPFALLMPVETLGAQSAMKLFREHGVSVIFPPKRINFKMPNIGWEGSGAQFPVAWFVWQIPLPSQMVFAPDERLRAKPAV